MAIRILLVEDDAQARGLIREYLSADATMQILAETCRGEEAVRLAEQLRPDIVLMDLSLEGMDGLKATQQIRARCPEVKVVILTNYQFEDLKERVRENADTVGAAAFLGKEEISRRLLTVIRTLARGSSEADR